jgi:RNA polymerase-binding transcription factor DksA
MAKKVQKDEKIEETALKVETTKAKSVEKTDTTKVVPKESSVSQTAKSEIVSKTSKKIAEVKIDTNKKTEPVKEKVVENSTKPLTQVTKPSVDKPEKADPVIKSTEPNPVKENKKSKTSEPVIDVKAVVSDFTEDKSNGKDDNNKIYDPNERPARVETPPVVIENAISDPTVRYSDDDLEEFAKIIKESKEEALEELRMLKERLEDLTSSDIAEESMIYSMHMAEQGSEAQEKEKTYAQIQRIQEYLKKLEDAMDRIKNKTYGICRVCGCLIAKARLMAVPITTLSASYKIHQRCPEDGNDRIEAIKK